MSKLEISQERAGEKTHRYPVETLHEAHDLAYETFHSEIFANRSLTDWSRERTHSDATKAEARLALKKADRSGKSLK